MTIFQRHLNKSLVLLFLLFPLIQFAIQIRPIFYGVETLVSFSRDDTFYYLNSAWNLHEYGFVTFDGIHSTNGVQFLWYWILVGLNIITPTKEALLYASFILTVLINLLSYINLWSIGSVAGTRILSFSLAIFLLYTQISSQMYIIGMENSIHLFFLTLFIHRFLILIKNSRQGEVKSRDLLLAAFILSLNVWSRIDAVFYVIPLFLYCLYLFFFRNTNYQPKIMAAALLIAGVMAAIMFMGFYWMDGSFLPTSGQVKQANFFDGIFSHLDAFIFKGWMLSNPLLGAVTPLNGPTIFDSITIENISKRYLLMLLVCLVVPYLFLEYKYFKGISKLKNTLLPELLVVMGGAIAIWLVAISGFAPVFINYYAPINVLVILFSGCWVYRLINLSRPKYSSIKLVYRGEQWIAFSAILLGVLLLCGHSVSSYDGFLFKSALPRNSSRYDYACWLDENVEQDVRIGSWNAGIIGYFSNRQTVNLDGVVNSHTYYRDFIVGNNSLIDYLNQNHIVYVADHSIYDPDVAETFIPVPLPADLQEYDLVLNPAYKGESRFTILFHLIIRLVFA